jgi:ADP-ribose pyrophosphatase
VRDKELLFQGRRFSVYRYPASGSDGALHAHEVVVHPGAAVILPLLAGDRVLLIANERVAVGRELLELPAGTLDPPETPLECARRELAEETGYQAGRLEPLLCLYSSPGICTELLHAFVATELTPGPTRLDAGEQIRLVPMPYGEALAAIGQKRIVDAKTIATLLYYDCFARVGGGGE